MNTLPRRWTLLIILLLVIVGILFAWWNGSAPSELPATEATPSLIPSEPPSDLFNATISQQLNFTFTLPSGWSMQLLDRNQIASNSQPVSQQLPRLRASLEQLLNAFQPTSQLLLLQAEPSLPQSTKFLLFSIPAHGLRLEEVATFFAKDIPFSKLIDTSTRRDGQAILRINAAQLEGLDSFAQSPDQIAILNNYRNQELIVVLQIDAHQSTDNLTDQAILEDILRSIELSPK